MSEGYEIIENRYTDKLNGQNIFILESVMIDHDHEDIRISETVWNEEGKELFYSSTDGDSYVNGKDVSEVTFELIRNEYIN